MHILYACFQHANVIHKYEATIVLCVYIILFTVLTIVLIQL